MKTGKEIQIDLGQFLSKRLYPLSLGIGLVISFCFPITYYVLEYKGGQRTASHLADKSADKLKDVIIASPNLWKYQIYSFTEIEREMSQGSDVLSLRILDGKGAPIPNYQYQQHSWEKTVWWNRWAPKGSADILFNNEKVGRIEVVISQRIILLKTLLLFLVSASAGLLLAFLSYNFPLKIVQRLEAELQEQFNNIQQAYKESDLLRHLAQESEKRFRDLVDGLDAVVWEADAQSRRFTFISNQVENMFLIPMEEWLSAADFFKEQIERGDRERVLAAYQRSVEEEAGCRLEYRRISNDGTVVWVQDNIRIVSDEEGKKQLRGVMVDVTHKKNAEEALNMLNRELQNSVHQLQQRNLEVSTFHELSEMFQLCREREEAYRIIGVAARKLFPEDSGAFYILDSSRNMLVLSNTWGETVQHEAQFSPETCWALRRGRNPRLSTNNHLFCENIGSEINPRCFCIPMLSQGETIGVFHMVPSCAATAPNEAGHDDNEEKYQLAVSMTENVAMAVANLSLRESLRYLSIRDPLTGLFNRRYMEETLQRKLMFAERMKRTLGIIMIDLDHFKRFNDTHGHDAGDTLLREFGSFLLNNIREYDFACRYGGEEFICILPETTLEKTLERAEELRGNLKSFKAEHLGRPLEKFTFSAGVAVYPEHGATAAEIVKAADEALYLAKRKGRNRIVAAVVKGPPVEKEKLLKLITSRNTAALPGKNDKPWNYKRP
ncbi:MAG: diguanylate cyclase [Desulfobacteraceae bacterium]|nr:diguanylate cyclase [Desulfobacteraceae bacterium]